MDYFVAAEHKLVEPEQIVSVLIYIDLQFFVERVLCQFVVVGECDNVVSQFLVSAIYLVGPVFAFVENAFDARVGMEISLLPAVGGVYVPVGVKYIRPGEWFRLSEVIYITATCTYNDYQCNEEYCI